MTDDHDTQASQHEANQLRLFDFGAERSEAMLSAQKELLDTWQQSMTNWFARAQTEASLWSELTAKLAGSESVPKAVEAYGQCVSQQMQMSMEDAQRLFNDYQQFTRKFANSFGGWSMTGTA